MRMNIRRTSLEPAIFSCEFLNTFDMQLDTNCYVRDDARVENNQIQYDNRVIEAGKFIVGIDYRRFTDAASDHDVSSRIKELETLYKDKQVIIGVDRMDYTKGLPEKLEGFRVFLEEHPEMSDKVVLIQIAVPSREDVKEYQDLEAQVSKLVGQITGKHGM
jgi:trehalose 6-phosphate synthase